MKTFTLGDYDYQAKDCIDNVLIDPLTPAHFWTMPVQDREPEELEKWEGLPFIVSDPNGTFRVYCLNFGAWDRPSLINASDNLPELIAIITQHQHAKH